MKTIIFAVMLTIAGETTTGGNTHALIVTGINKNAKEYQFNIIAKILSSYPDTDQ